MMWRSLMMDFTQFIPIPNVSVKYPLKYEQGILEYQTVPFLSFPAGNYPKTIMKEEKQVFNDWKACDDLSPSRICSGVNHSGQSFGLFGSTTGGFNQRMFGRLLSVWESNSSGAVLNFRWVF